jgi:hypothetical protein
MAATQIVADRNAPHDVAILRAKMTPHPWKAFDERLHFINGDAALRIPRTNINCVASIRHSSAADRAKQLDGHRNFEIDTGHDLMMTEPRKVADMLLEVAST